MTTTILALLLGSLAGLALCAVAAIFVPATPDISDTLQRLYDPSAARRARQAAQLQEENHTSMDTFGSWVQRHTRLLPAGVSMADLDAIELPQTRLYAYKALIALLGGSTSVLMGAVQALMGVPSMTLPGLVGVLLAIGGWVLPDMLARAQAQAKREQFVRTVTSYYDLVTLMRISGATVTDAITVPAQIADAGLFVRIRGTLARQQLEHKRPWDGLVELADDIALPELRDLGDLMAMSGERGTPASATLKAKARDIRSERLNQDMELAQRDLQRSTIYQVVLLGVIILLLAIPPLLRLTAS